MSNVTCQVPHDELVTELLSGLLGREVRATWAPGSYQPPAVGRVACYSDDDDRLLAVAIADAGFACRAGAALVLITPGGADEAAEAGQIPETLDENFHEVVNIMATLLNGDDSTHVRLTSVLPLGAPLPEQVAATIEKPTKRRVFHVSIEGYGRGVVTFLFV